MEGEFVFEPNLTVAFETQRATTTESYSSLIFERLLKDWQIQLFQSVPQFILADLPPAPYSLLPIATTPTEVEEWRAAAVRSLAKYWNTPEEDEAWADL